MQKIALKRLTNYQNELLKAIDNTTDEKEISNYSNQLTKVEELLELVRKRVDDYRNSQEKLNELLIEDYTLNNYTEKIEGLNQYKQAIDDINKMELLSGFQGTIEEQREMIKRL